MGTPLYNTDIIPMTSRPTLTVMDDGDYFVILDTSTAKISKILKTNVVLPANQASYDNSTSGLTATQVQAALDELVVNLGSSDSAILALAGRLDTAEGGIDDLQTAETAIKGTGWTDENLVDHEDRLDTLEGTGAGSVAKAIEDAVSPIEEDITDHESRIAQNESDIGTLETVVDTNRLYSDSQYLALKAKADSLQVKCNTLQAEVYTDDPILQYSATEIIGKGYEADDTPIDVSANVVDGSLELEQKGLTITNLEPYGDFEVDSNADGTPDGWTKSGAGVVTSQSSDAISGQSSLKVTGSKTGVYRDIAKCISGHVYFLSVWMKTSAGMASVRLSAGGNFKRRIITTSSTWVKVSAVFTSDGTENRWYLENETMTADMQWDALMLLDLTALGLSTITDTAILAKLLPYVDGTANVGKMGMRVIGNNLFDGEVISGSGVTSISYSKSSFSLYVTGAGSGDTERTVIDLLKNVKYFPLTQYTFSGKHRQLDTKNPRLIIAYSDGTYQEFPVSTTSETSFSVTSTVGKTIRNVGYNYGSGGGTVFYSDFMLNLGSSALPYVPYQEQLTFLPAIGNSLPNGTADSIKTVADGWEHTKRVSDGEFLTGLNALATVSTRTNTMLVYIPGSNYPALYRPPADSVTIFYNTSFPQKNVYSIDEEGMFINVNGHVFLSILKSRLVTENIAGVKTYLTANPIYFAYQLATPVITHYDLPHLTSGKTIHRFAGEEKISLYGTGVTFSENVLSVLSAIKFVAGVMTDITSLATITDDTVTFTGVSATDVVYVKAEHDVDRPLGILEHTPAVSNTASRLASLEARVSALEV